MSAQPVSPARRARLWRTAAAVVVLLGVAAYLLVQYVTSGPGAPRCTVRVQGGGDPYELTPEQAANAATISAVAASRGLPERAVTIALATAMQESGLRNINFGDRDSVGLFQQRPSQDWGTVQQIMDPVYSSGEFYRHLVKVPGYSRLPLTVAAQKVQRSGYPQAYAKHEANAALLTGALTGRSGDVLSCTVSHPVDGAGPDGPAKVRQKLVREFGAGVLPTAAAGGQDAAAGGGVTVPVRPAGVASAAPGEAAQRGWQLANWALAHAADLHIERISYAGRTWTAADSDQGWQRAAGGDAGAGRAGDGAGAGDAVRIVTAR
ncbi:heavy metal transporter [Streptomyces sp. RS10V-4]|uniref:heavy metal transporter n=1 Tax=Streptomyces rhizoryzae TaxID=2932493 RepID=UPI0020068CA7|nr:heavy metal transporter [Streptomyces rhizoryzae]MCK7624130.1 heavy metal transporter [Streptomyces rhizoryzae]